MSRVSDTANSVVSACETACAINRVPVMRMNSRTFLVPGKGGRERPMFTGEWTDQLGVKRRKGMADLFAMPRIQILQDQTLTIETTVPLWIECKSGSGILTEEQELFRSFVEYAGAYYILAKDSADAVMAWFKEHRVRRR